MYSNNLEGRQGSDLIQYSTPWEYKPTNKQTNVTVFKLPSIGDLRQNRLQNILRKFDKITQSIRVCTKHFEDKDLHSFIIHTNPDETT